MAGDNNSNGNEPKIPRFNFNNRAALISLLVLIGFFIFFFFLQDGDMAREIPYSLFLNYLESGNVASVKVLDGQLIRGELRGGSSTLTSFRTIIPYFDPNLIERMIEKSVTIQGGSRAVSPLKVFFEFLPWVIGFFFIWFMFRQVQGSGNKAFSFGKSRAKRYLNKGTKTTFADVAGQDEAKYELQEVVEFLKNPTKFTRIGAKIPKGVLLLGMPGTGNYVTQLVM